MAGVALKPLTVDFHETGFVTGLAKENGQGFWFQMDRQDRQQAPAPWGPANAQALNRYSYVQNSSLNYTDPTGHEMCPVGQNGNVGYCDYMYLNWEEVAAFHDIITIIQFEKNAGASLYDAINLAIDGIPIPWLVGFARSLFSSMTDSKNTVRAITIMVNLLGKYLGRGDKSAELRLEFEQRAPGSAQDFYINVHIRQNGGGWKVMGSVENINASDQHIFKNAIREAKERTKGRAAGSRRDRRGV